MNAADLTASAALAAVLNAPDLASAHAAASAGLDSISTAAPADVLEVSEAAELAGRTASTVRRWCVKRHIGRRLGGRWIVSRRRLAALMEGER